MYPSPSPLLDVARRSDATLYVVEVPSALLDSGDARQRRLEQEGEGSIDSFLFFRPFYENPTDAITEAAELTGGVYYEARVVGVWPRDVIGALESIFEEFRQSYVIKYTAENVAPTGWHEVEVKVKGVDAKGVRARRGYFGGVAAQTDDPLPARR